MPIPRAICPELPSPADRTLRGRGHRRGNYAMMMAAALVPMLGMGAFSIDLSMLALARSECQDIADAAADAGLIALRNTGNKVLADTIAREVVASNLALSGAPNVVKVEIGKWENDTFTADESPGDVGSNAVNVVLDADVDFVLAPLINSYSSTVNAAAVAAARPVELILVIDITNSWNQGNFTSGARDASVKAFDLLAANAGPDDLLGMAVFTGEYGVEHTPMMTFSQHAIASSGGSGLPTRQDWEVLHTASKTTDGRPTNIDTQKCNGNGDNDFDLSDPSQECYPFMWREYKDESGTDHAIGLKMASDMFDEVGSSGAYRAVIILTDGEPNGTGNHTQRGILGYEEQRWDFIRADEGRNKDEVIAATKLEALNLSAAHDTNIWAISFKANATWMNDVAQGEGYFEKVDNANELVPLFQSIVESLPVALVR